MGAATEPTPMTRPGLLGPVRPGLKPYRPPVLDPRVNLRLDSNEGPGVPEVLVNALRNIDPAHMQRYPSAAELERELAATHGVDPQRVIVTAGGDDALGRLFDAYLCPGRNAVLTDPTFEMIPRGVQASGAEMRTTAWRAGTLPSRELCASIDIQTALVFLVTPNNPTGLSCSIDQARALAGRLRDVGACGVLVLDLAYAEFDDNDHMPLVDEFADVVAVRTFSKAWSLAGLRVGYAVGDAGVIGALRSVGHPYAVSGPSLAVATEAARLARSGALTPVIARIARERADLSALLQTLGFNVTPSSANFVLAERDDAARVHEALLNEGISVRRWSGRPGLEHVLRITCPGDEAGFDTLCAAIRKVAGALPETGQQGDTPS